MEIRRFRIVSLQFRARIFRNEPSQQLKADFLSVFHPWLIILYSNKDYAFCFPGRV
jgi:hypothetical protein